MSRSSSQPVVARWLLAAACLVPSIGLWACDHEWDDLRYAGEGGSAGTTSSSTGGGSTTTTTSDSITTTSPSTSVTSTTTTSTIPDCSMGACEHCLVSSCASETCANLRQACDEPDPCADLEICVIQCGWNNPDCHATCAEEFPGGYDLWSELYTCLACEACGQDCQDAWICL